MRLVIAPGDSRRAAASARNVRVVRDFYAALGRGDLDAARRALMPDSVLHVPGRSANTGDYRGQDAIIGFLVKARTVTEGTLRLDVHQVLADDEQAVALATYTATRPDRAVPLKNNLAHVITLRDGLIAEPWLHSRDQYIASDQPTIRTTWVDGGYRRHLVEHAATVGIDVQIVQRPPGTRGFTPLPPRWVAERTLGWLMRHRRLVRDYETLPASSQAMFHIAMIDLMSRRLTGDAPHLARNLTWNQTESAG